MATDQLNKQRQLELRAMPLAQLRSIRLGTWRTCINCDSWLQATEGCKKASGARPPAAVIVIGCDNWIEKIPF